MNGPPAKARSFADVIAECDGEQAAILLRWSAEADRALASLETVFGADIKMSAAAGAAMKSLRSVAAELREAGDGLRARVAVQRRDAAIAREAAGFAPQQMARVRSPK